MPKMDLRLAPVLGHNDKGTPRYDWKLQRIAGESKHEIVVRTKREAAKALKNAICDGLAHGFTVDALFVDQTGGGVAATYHADGTMKDRRMISPKEGLLGPRCFEIPTTKLEQRKRRAALRPPKAAAAAKPTRKPKTPKPKAPAKSAKPKVSAKAKTPAKPKTAKPQAARAMPPAIASFHSAAEGKVGNAVAYLTALAPKKLGGLKLAFAKGKGIPTSLRALYKAALEKMSAKAKSVKPKSAKKPTPVKAKSAKKPTTPRATVKAKTPKAKTPRAKTPKAKTAPVRPPTVRPPTVRPPTVRPPTRAPTAPRARTAPPPAGGGGEAAALLAALQQTATTIRAM